MKGRSRALPNICICLHCIGHGTDPEPRAHRELFISPGEAEALFAYLKSEGYRFTLPGEAAEKSGPVCSVTFDDGYYNNRHFLETAEKYDIPFILFLNSYNVVHQVPFIWDIWEATRTERWPVSSVNYRKLYESLSPDARALLNNDTHRPFTLEELETFAAHPLVRLAPHGHSHQPMVGKYMDQADDELDENLAFLVKYKSSLKEDFSLPCGLYTRRLIQKLLARFTRIYTIDGGGFLPHQRVINRVSLIHPDFGGPLREQITKSFTVKTRLLRKALNFRYTSRLFSVFNRAQSPMRCSASVLIIPKERILRNIPDDVGREDLCYYLCDDYASFMNVRKRFPDRITPRLLGDQFHKTIEEISGAFLEYSHQINSRNRSYEFWGTHLASRNSGAIPLLKNIVYLCCAKKIMDRTSGQRIVFICDSPALARLIKEETARRGLHCRIFPIPLVHLKRAWCSVRLIAKGLYYLISGILQLLYARTLRNQRITEAPPAERYILRSWVTAGSIDGRGRYRDRNFGVLPEYLAEQGKDVWTIPLYFSLDRNIFAQMKLMSGTGRKVLLPEQYLSFSDSWKTLRDGVRGLSLDLHGCEFQGIDIRPLVMEIHRSVGLHPSYLSYNSIRYLLKRLAEKDVEVDCFIYPLENNPPEKPFILAVREHYPNARLIGFQHTAWLKEQMSVVLLPEELSYHPLPERIVCSGRRYLDILKSSGFPPEILMPGPNLRYMAVNQFVGTSNPNDGGVPRKLLIILNYDSNQNMELLEKAGQALKSQADIRILIKAHPTTDVQRMSGFLKDIHFPRYEWAAGTVMEQLGQVHAVLMTGGSVSSMETIAAGVPLVRVSLENNFDFDCLWDDGPLPPPASAASELRRYLDEALKASRTEREHLRQYGKAMVENYFEPVTNETLRVFL